MSSKAEIEWPYRVLQLEENTTDIKIIKRAYAKCLKKIDQVNDLNGFQDLREAYETALIWRAEEIEENTIQARGTVPVSDVIKSEHYYQDSMGTASYQKVAAHSETHTREADVKELINQLSTEIPDENFAQKVLRILSDPLLADPDVMARVEIELITCLHRKIAVAEDNKNPYLDESVTQELVWELEGRFNWR